MDAVITQGVSMCNPEALTREQLVEEVTRLQTEGMQTTQGR